MDRLVICDEEGLRRLLERTSLKENQEWGTVLRNDGNTISQILDSFEAERIGLVVGKGKGFVVHDMTLGEGLGYTGTHHYHPKEDFDPSQNFLVHKEDRNCVDGKGIHLLTFNMPYGPEIIAYDRNKTFIPADRNNKHILLPVSEEQLREIVRNHERLPRNPIIASMELNELYRREVSSREAGDRN